MIPLEILRHYGACEDAMEWVGKQKTKSIVNLRLDRIERDE